MKHRLHILLTALLVLAYSCDSSAQKTSGSNTKGTSAPLKYYTFEIINELPHSMTSYTQGFQYADGVFWEGTGGNGSSVLQIVNPYSGEATKSVSLSREYFGEGITLLGGEIFQLTWRKGKAFVYDKKTLKKLREHKYKGEGWGLTTDGKVLYMSDGTDKITIRDPKTFKEIGSFSVTLGKRKTLNLNELEWIEGEIWANVYLTNNIYRIDPSTGKVVGIIDLTGMQSPHDIYYTTDVLNGIAYDPATGRIWLTGKNWNKVYEVKIKEK